LLARFGPVPCPGKNRMPQSLPSAPFAQAFGPYSGAPGPAIFLKSGFTWVYTFLGLHWVNLLIIN
jgi:hypothetical protein